METNIRRMETILQRTNCPKHKAPKGIPCWHILKNVPSVYIPGGTSLDYYAAACGGRLKRAGFKAPITNKSPNVGAPHGQYSPSSRGR